MSFKVLLKHALLVLFVILILGAGGLYELLSSPIRFCINRHNVELFRKEFPNAVQFNRDFGGIGLTAQREIPGRPSYHFEADLDLSYIPGRTNLVVKLVERVEENLFAVRNELIFAGPLISEILKGPIDHRLFEKYPSLYPKESPVPRKRNLKVSSLILGIQTALFSDSFLLKVSVDQFSKNRYIPISNPRGGDEDISSDEDEAGCSFNLVSEGNVREIFAKSRIKIRPQSSPIVKLFQNLCVAFVLLCCPRSFIIHRSAIRIPQFLREQRLGRFLFHNWQLSY
jgi:hypothetical protein